MAMLIPLKSNRPGEFFAKVDFEDYENVCGYTWRLCPSENKGWIGYYAIRYVTVGETGKVKEAWAYIKLHHHLLGRPGVPIAFLNGDGLDCTRKNMKFANWSQCQQKRHKQETYGSVKTSSMYKGVSLRRSGKWRAYITKDGKQKCLGQYENEIVAARVYDEAALRLFGEFANTNFK